MADLAVQVVAKPLSIVTSPAMPPYAERIAMHRTSSSSSPLIATLAFSAAVNVLRHNCVVLEPHISDACWHLLAIDVASFARYDQRMMHEQCVAACFAQEAICLVGMSHHGPVHGIEAHLGRPTFGHGRRSSWPGRIAILRRHAGELIHNPQANRGQGHPHVVPLGLSTHEPHQQRHVRVQDSIFQAYDAYAP